jgi:hypothetical protein
MEGIEIQLYDKYFVLDWISFAVMVITPIVLVTSLVFAIRSKFMMRKANLGLLLSVVLIVVIIVRMRALQEAYQNSMLSPGHAIPVNTTTSV